jgi:hypothetical protein
MKGMGIRFRGKEKLGESPKCCWTMNFEADCPKPSEMFIQLPKGSIMSYCKRHYDELKDAFDKAGWKEITREEYIIAQIMNV